MSGKKEVFSIEIIPYMDRGDSLKLEKYKLVKYWGTNTEDKKLRQN